MTGNGIKPDGLIEEWLFEDNSTGTYNPSSTAFSRALGADPTNYTTGEVGKAFQLLFGTDYPFNNFVFQDKVLKNLLALDIAKQLQEKILSTNFSNLIQS